MSFDIDALGLSHWLLLNLMAVMLRERNLSRSNSTMLLSLKLNDVALAQTQRGCSRSNSTRLLSLKLNEVDIASLSTMLLSLRSQRC